MDRSEEAKGTALLLTRTFESVCTKLKAEKGVTDEQIGLALMAAGLNFLSSAWTGEQIVRHLTGITSALMDVHGIDPTTGEEVGRAKPN